MATQKTAVQPQLRLRIFAGPNGSGKSTIIKSIREAKVDGRPIDFGHYINADDIASALRSGSYAFDTLGIAATRSALLEFAASSGLLRDGLTGDDLVASIRFSGNEITLLAPPRVEWVAQILARYLRDGLLAARKRFSVETVFSHPSNLDLMRRAIEAGYKVYLYFVSTESYHINQYRVDLRVRQGGHDVPPERIRERYFRSLDLLYDAVQLSYQAFLFDNSGDTYKPFYHCRQLSTTLFEDDTQKAAWPEWFKKYYIAKRERT